MAAWTEGFTDLRKDTNLVGNIVSKVLAARKMAESERLYAQKQLNAHLKRTNQQGTRTLSDYGIGRGYFFKKALGHEFGGDFATRTRDKLKFYKDKVNLLKKPRQNFWQLFDKQQQKTKAQRFREKFRYREGFEYIDSLTGKTPILTPKTLRLPPATKGKKASTKVVGTGSAKKVQKATGGGKTRVTKEELGTVLTDLVASLERTASSLSNSTAKNSEAISQTVQLQSKILDSLKYRENILEDKLTRLISAIEGQTHIQKSAFKKAEFRDKENKIEVQQDVASAKAFDDLTTKEDESVINAVEPTTPITSIQNVNIGATSSQRAEHEQMQAYGSLPQLETGGIYSGPDSGYLAKLKAGDTVIPLDNNYTQGEPSAVDGKVRKMPMYEKGTRGSSVGGKFGFGITNMTGMGRGGTTQSSAMAQPLVDAMSLPMMATGGTVLATVSKLVNSMGSEGDSIAPEIEKISRPIADVFGLPSAVTQKAKSEGKKLATGVGKEEAKEDGVSKKNLISKMMDGFGKLLEGLGKKIEEERPDPTSPTGGSNLIPGDAPPEIKALMQTISGGEGGPESVQGIGEVKGLSNMTIDDAIAKAKSFIGKGSSTGALGAYQFHSSYLRQRAIDAGLDPSKDKFTLENQTEIMRNFMTSVWEAGGGTGGEEGLVQALKSGQLESSVFPKLSKDLGWPSLPGGSQQNVHSAGSASRYKANLKTYQQAAAAPTAMSPITQQNINLGQQIQNNYGMKIGEERSFTHPQYGVIKAHKTQKGFDFYGPGLNNKLDMSSTKPQARSIVQFFESSNGGRPQQVTSSASRSSVAPSSNTSLENAQAIAKPLDSGSGSSIALLNIGGNNSTNNNSTTVNPASQPRVAEGNPLARDLYPNILA